MKVSFNSFLFSAIYIEEAPAHVECFSLDTNNSALPLDVNNPLDIESQPIFFDEDIIMSPLLDQVLKNPLRESAAVSEEQKRKPTVGMFSNKKFLLDFSNYELYCSTNK